MLTLYQHLARKNIQYFLQLCCKTNWFLFKLLPQRIVINLIRVEIFWSEKKGIGIINLKVISFPAKVKSNIKIAIKKKTLPILCFCTADFYAAFQNY